MTGSNVPSFGNWDSEEDVPYTIYFEKARKNRGGKIINPNDPQENPDMFPSKAPRAAAPPAHSPSSEEHGVLHYEEAPVGYGASARPPMHKRQMSKDNSDHLNHSNSPAGNENSMGKKGSFEKSPHHPQHHQGKGQDGKKSHENIRGSATPGRTYNNNNNSNSGSQQGTLGKSYGTPGRSRQKHESPDRGGAAALPKFGEWDEKDSQSADNYSYIFNTHRDERHTDASSNVMRTPTRPRPNARNQDDDDKFQKRCCPWWSKR